MASIKCVHCGVESDPEDTAGYCEECGKKLPGLYIPTRSVRPSKDEGDAGGTKPDSAGRAGRDPTPAAVFAIVGFLAAALGGLSLIFWGDKAQSGVVCLVTFVGLGISGFVVALRGAFASREDLLGMSDWIGTRNPTAARIVCWLVLLLLVALATLAGLMVFSADLRRAIGFSG